MIFISPKICVKPSPVHRWGVFAVDFIAEGEIIEECPMVELEKSWLEKEDKILSKYRFNFPSGGIPESQQVCLGYGSLYNHSNQPNVYWQSVCIYTAYIYGIYTAVRVSASVRDERSCWVCGECKRIDISHRQG
jgi:hypothetical protein